MEYADSREEFYPLQPSDSLCNVPLADKHSRSPGLPSEHELAVFRVMAQNAADSKMYREIGDANATLMIMLAARELSIPPMQALNGGLNIINGKIEISARMITALIRRAGHGIHILKSDDKECVLIGHRLDTGEQLEVSYSVEEAKRAGLVKEKGGWMKHPRDMCFARAASRLARQLFSDVIGMSYVEGEISETSSMKQRKNGVKVSGNAEKVPCSDDFNGKGDIAKETDSEVGLMHEFESFIESKGYDKDECYQFINFIANRTSCASELVQKQWMEMPDRVHVSFQKWKDTNAS